MDAEFAQDTARPFAVGRQQQPRQQHALVSVDTDPVAVAATVLMDRASVVYAVAMDWVCWDFAV